MSLDDEIRALSRNLERAGLSRAEIAREWLAGPIQFKLRVDRETPAHVYVTVFSRQLPTETWANSGQLTLRVREYPALQALLGNHP